MAFKFFNIGKANEEITRLEGETTRLNTELTAANENAAVVAKSAESMKTDLAAAQSKVTELETKFSQTASDLGAAQTSVTALTKERDELKATIENPDGEIEKRASLRALEIAKNQGTTAVAIKPDKTETTNIDPKLTGLERAIAAHKLSQKKD